jgi:hypothetical protein
MALQVIGAGLARTGTTPLKEVAQVVMTAVRTLR